MAVLIATGLRKEHSGDPLSTGSRSRCAAATGSRSRARTAPARRRCYVRCGRDVAAGRRARVRQGCADRAPRPAPAARARVTLREYALSGAADLAAIEEELRGLEQAMAGGATTPRRYGATARRPRAWSTPVAGTGVTARVGAARLGFRDAELDRPLDTFSGGELTRASLARRSPATPTCCCSTSRRTTSTSRAWSGSSGSCRARRRRDPRRTRPLVPGGGDDGRARARRPATVLLRRALARVATREGGASVAAATTVGRVSDDIERLERFVARFRYKKSKAKQAQAKLTRSRGSRSSGGQPPTS